MSDKQTKIVKRIASICDEFDHRAEKVTTLIARLELAKALAELEASEASLRAQLAQFIQAEGEATAAVMRGGHKRIAELESQLAASEAALERVRKLDGLFEQMAYDDVEGEDFVSVLRATLSQQPGDKPAVA